MFNIKKKRIVLYIAVIGLLIFLYNLKIFQPIENIVISTINPLLNRAHSFGSKLNVTYQEQTKNLKV